MTSVMAAVVIVLARRTEPSVGLMEVMVRRERLDRTSKDTTARKQT